MKYGYNGYTILGGIMQECLALLIEEKLSVLLILLKIFPNLKGYNFIKEGAKRIIQDRDKKVKVGLKLYQEIANDHDTKLDVVDRSMRHCLDVSYKREGLIAFEKAFCIKFSSVKPRPKELLCALAEMAYREVQKEMAKLKLV